MRCRRSEAEGVPFASPPFSSTGSPKSVRMTSASLASLLGMLIFVFTMVHSAVTDLVSFRIRNRILVLALLAYSVLAPIAGRSTVEILLGFAVAAAVLLIGFCLFSFGWIGGGDAKLASVTSLWCGADLTLDYVLYTSLVGGLLTLGILTLRAQATAPWLEHTRKAKDGDEQAASLILSRIWPARKGRPVRLDLPAITSASDVVAAIGLVADAVGAGTLTPDEGQAVSAVLEAKCRAIETVELEARVIALERERDR